MVLLNTHRSALVWHRSARQNGGTVHNIVQFLGAHIAFRCTQEWSHWTLRIVLRQQLKKQKGSLELSSEHLSCYTRPSVQRGCNS